MTKSFSLKLFIGISDFIFSTIEFLIGIYYGSSALISLPLIVYTYWLKKSSMNLVSPKRYQNIMKICFGILLSAISAGLLWKSIGIFMSILQKLPINLLNKKILFLFLILFLFYEVRNKLIEYIIKKNNYGESNVLLLETRKDNLFYVFVLIGLTLAIINSQIGISVDSIIGISISIIVIYNNISFIYNEIIKLSSNYKK